MTTSGRARGAFPRVRPSGDGGLLLEFGDGMDLRHSLAALAVKERIESLGIDGFTEATQGLASLLVQFDPDVCRPSRMSAAIVDLLEDAVVGAKVLDSRIVHIPILYGDPWTRDCIDDYRRRYGEIGDNLETVASFSGLSSAAEVVQHHTGTDYWVAGLGTWPGLPFVFPMDPAYRLRAPKYNPARTWTPVGSIGLGGSCTSIYSIESPGGYQLLGRTPVPIWSTGSRPWRDDSPALFRAGDRILFSSIDREEYDDVRARMAAGSYEPQIEDGSIVVDERWGGDRRGE